MSTKASDLGLTLPLRIKLAKESVAVIDSCDRIAAYVYFSSIPEHAGAAKRVMQDEAVEIAKVCARALTDALSASARA